jgi:hypothetical protein
LTPLNFVIKGINLISPIKIPELKLAIPNIPRFDVGTRYLPEDMLVQAHKGEMIVPKSENPYANSGNGKTLPNGSGLTLTIDTFINNRKEDIEELAQELQFYMKQKQLGGSN